MLTSLIAPSSGQATVNGFDVVTQAQSVRASVGVLTETPGLYLKLTAVQNLRLYGKLHSVEKLDQQIERYLNLLGLWDRRDEPVGGFSKGMRQKLAIARALLHEPPVVFLDEPTAALDPQSAGVVRDFIGDLKDENRTVFICTHNLNEADRLCDRIGIIKTKLIEVDTPERLRQELYGDRVEVQLASMKTKFVELVEQMDFVDSVVVSETTLRVELDEPTRDNPELIRTLVNAGAEIQFVQKEHHSLEKVYLDLIAEDDESAQEEAAL